MHQQIGESNLRKHTPSSFFSFGVLTHAWKGCDACSFPGAEGEITELVFKMGACHYRPSQPSPHQPFYVSHLSHPESTVPLWNPMQRLYTFLSLTNSVSFFVFRKAFFWRLLYKLTTVNSGVCNWYLIIHSTHGEMETLVRLTFTASLGSRKPLHMFFLFYGLGSWKAGKATKHFLQWSSPPSSHFPRSSPPTATEDGLASIPSPNFFVLRLTQLT